MMLFLIMLTSINAWAEELIYISSESDWNTLASNVSGGTSYSGVYVVLDADIAVTTMVGTSEHPFDGHFCGNGYTLTVSYDASNQTYVAPFCYASGAIIQDLHVAGTIAASTNNAAGLIGDAGTGTSITNCLVSTTITGNATYSYYVAGTSVTLTNSYYTSTVGNAQGNQAHTITADPVANMTLTGNVGVQYGSTVYAADGETVSLTMTDPSNPPAGYSLIDGNYRAGSQILNPDEGVYKVTISGQDVIITCFTLSTYSITYHPGEGATFATTNTSYNILSDDITLDTPTKEGYDFAGWYTNSGLTEGPVTTIAQGSTGNKEFWAKWTPTEYAITYHACEGATFSTANTSYDIESPAITLDTPTKEHYVFAGWYTNSGLTGDPVTTIAHGSTGPKEFWAKWTPTAYNITYYLNDGTVSAPETWVIKATLNKHIGSDDFGFKINGGSINWVYSTPSETGTDYFYTYEGSQPSTIEFLHYNSSGNNYTSGSQSFNPSGGNFSIPGKGIIGSYTIVSHKANPATYTIESPDFTLNTPQKTGHAFKGWTGTGLTSATKDVTITSGSTGERVYTATWGDIIDIANSNCKATVPDQMLDDYDNFYYKFEAANNPSSGVTINEVVTDGETTLTLGKDYEFGDVYFYGTTTPSTANENRVGDHFTVEIKGIGDYTGTREADFYMGVYVKPSKYGNNLTWSLSKGVLTISGSGKMATAAAGGYPWFQYANYISSITIGKDVTYIADDAFNRTSEVNVYCNVTTVTLPEKLDTIGGYAFAYCTGATINLDKIPSGTKIGTNAFYQVGKLVGTLKESSDNTDLIDVMPQASKADVTISGRTLKKDGSWNSLCLPFDIDNIDAQEEGVYTCPLHGATILELDNGAEGTTFDNHSGKLTLKFKAATSIEAGKPYLVKWTKPEGYDGNPSNFDIINPTFTNVKIRSYVPAQVTSFGGSVTFMGSYSPYTNNEVLLKESAATTATNAFHAVVKVNDQLSYAVEGVYDNSGFTGDQITTLTLDADNKMVCYVKTGSLVPVATDYVDENGTSQTADALVLDASWTTLPAGTYVVNSDINYNTTVTLLGDVTLILADGKKMQVGSPSQPISSDGIVCDGDKDHNLTIYGQSGQTGHMKIYIQKDGGSAIVAKDIAIYGGNVAVTNLDQGYGISGKNVTAKTGKVEVYSGLKAIVSEGKLDVSNSMVLTSIYDYAVGAGAVTISNSIVQVIGIKGFDCSSLDISNSTLNMECRNPGTADVLYCVKVSGDVTISNSQVSVNATQGVNYYIGLAANNVTISSSQVSVISESTAINTNYKCINAPVTFSYTKPTDFILANSYKALTIADNKQMSDGTDVYSGSLTPVEVDNVGGKILRPFKTLSLADNVDNTAAINEWNGGRSTVTLSGRTLKKDGNWNILCLPFDVKDSDYDPNGDYWHSNIKGGYDEKPLTGTPLEGCTLMELDTEGFYDNSNKRYTYSPSYNRYVDKNNNIYYGDVDNLRHTGIATNGRLYLYFMDAYEIEAGKPYLIKWDSGDNLVSPVFNCALIDNRMDNYALSEDTKVKFVGSYKPYVSTGGALLKESADASAQNAFRAFVEVNSLEALYSEQACTHASTTLKTGNSMVYYFPIGCRLTEEDGVTVLCSTWNGKTNLPVSFTRSGLTANAYSTMCLPFSFNAPSACTFYAFTGIDWNSTNQQWEATITEQNANATLNAHTPYIFKCTETEATFTGDIATVAASYGDTELSAGAVTATLGDDKAWTFKGTYTALDWTSAAPQEPTYGFSTYVPYNEGNTAGIAAGTFVRFVKGASLAPFRARLIYSGSNSHLRAPIRGTSDNADLPRYIVVRIVDENGGVTYVGTVDTATGEISNDVWFTLEGKMLTGEPAESGIYIYNGHKVSINR
ncbi:MAG: InlB B-repeat-containing protein [Bacteroidaceae bacterium]|nr:InlB B-repeat-containing protein [Bacteroidaceae bacterium]